MCDTPQKPKEPVFHCWKCERIYHISHMRVVQDAAVSFDPVYTGGVWHLPPPDLDCMNLYDHMDYYCQECGEEIAPPDDIPDTFWLWAPATSSP